MTFNTFHRPGPTRSGITAVLGVLLAVCFVGSLDAASLSRTREILEARHREYLQSLEKHGPGTIETRLAFDRYMLAYQRHEQAQTDDDSTAAASAVEKATAGGDDRYGELLEKGPGAGSDFKIGNLMLKSGDVSGAFDMYKLALGKVFVSPVKVFLIKLALFKDRLFGPKGPPDDDITGNLKPPQPPGKEDTNWIGSFKYERIMSDSSFSNVDAMSEREVQSFLERKGSCLAKPYRGTMPSRLIVQACRKHGISPKVMLARLQTEQGLVSKKSATQHQLDWALGVGCYDSGNWNNKYKGLEKQIEYAAVTLKSHYDKGQDLIAQNGVIAMTINGSPMRLQNAATYSMYKYCPHKQGNKLFYDVYVGYFALLLLLMGVLLI